MSLLSRLRINVKFRLSGLGHRIFSTIASVRSSTRISVSELFQKISEDNILLGKDEINVEGWIKYIRKGKKPGTMSFIQISDGLSPENLQIVLMDPDKIAPLSSNCAVSATGVLVASPGTQSVELQASDVVLVGDMNQEEYPIQPKIHFSFDFLRRHQAIRPKTAIFSSFLRVRSAAARILNQFFFDKNFVQIHTPIITSNDCEGAGENFAVVAPEDHALISSRSDYEKSKKYSNNEEDPKLFFSGPAYLTVSGQLHLEVASGGLSKVYCFGPAFRAEKSHSRYHLAEFYMLEAEMAFVQNLEEVMALVEECIKDLARKVKQWCSRDVEEVLKYQAAVPNPENIQSLPALDLVASCSEFPRITYSEAVKIINDRQEKFSQPVSLEKGLMKEHERFLVSYCGGVPVFVTHFPSRQKPFYMKRTDDEDLAVCFDLLAPNVGEICGGSLREDSYESLQKRLQKLGIEEQLKWYLNLREFGHAPLGGFGIGFERLLQCLLGIRNIKDCLPFPRWYTNCAL